MTTDEIERILDVAVRKWLSDVIIPQEYKTKETAKKPIPERAMPGILHSAFGAGMHTIVTVDGMHYIIYATFHGPRIWVNGNWNDDLPTVEGEAVMASVSRVAHRMRDEQVAEAEARKQQRLNRTQLPDAECTEAVTT